MPAALDGADPETLRCTEGWVALQKPAHGCRREARKLARIIGLDRSGFLPVILRHLRTARSFKAVRRW